MYFMKYFLRFFIFVFCLSVSAKQIDVATATSVAESFINESSSLNKKNAIILNLVYTSTSSSNAKTIKKPYVYYYIFNINNDQGFIIVSADDVNTPILGYSTTGSYNPKNVPDNFKSWMEMVSLGMEKAIINGTTPTKEIQKEWDNFRQGKKIYTKASKTIVVEPLIKTKWNQSYPYNSLLPYSGLYTGCVATAIAQIMNYYKYPKSGVGIIQSYSISNDNTTYYIPAIDLSKYTYDWSNMLNTYDYTPSGNDVQKKAVALLMYHIGASVKMSYSKSGSGAYSMDAAKALVTYFGYDKSLELRSRDDYGYSNDLNNAWDEMLRKELKNKRPIYYDGRGTGGHAFICDGYDDQGFFHFNWGWGGYQDGYFKTTATLDYTKNQSAMFNIKPSTGNISIPKLELNKDYTSISSEVTSGKGGAKFSTKFSFKNVSLFPFQGYYGVALTDEKDNIQYILAQSNLSELNSGYYYKEYNFYECVIPLGAKPGKYRLRMVSKVLGKNDWVIVTSPLSTVIKYIPFEILVGEEKAKLQILNNTPLSASKSSAKPNESFLVKLSFKNYSRIPFRGYYGIALTDNTNTIKYILAQSGLSELNPGYYYRLYNFNCFIPSNAMPGYYKLRMVSKAQGEQNWSLINAEVSSVIDQIPFEISNNKTYMNSISDKINIYPNPVLDKMYIQSTVNITKIVLYNMYGNLVLQASESELKNKMIDLGNLNSGIYIAHIYTSQGKTIYNVIKK